MGRNGTRADLRRGPRHLEGVVRPLGELENLVDAEADRPAAGAVDSRFGGAVDPRRRPSSTCASTFARNS